MPAAIRIDIHMGYFAGLINEGEDQDAYLDGLAQKLKEAVRACIMEYTNDLSDEQEGSLTDSLMVRPRIKRGLGDPWPPPPETTKPHRLWEGIEEELEKLGAGNWQANLMPLECYDDGSRYIYVSCDFS